MLKSRKSKQLDEMELELTPKQWAIRLVDDFRRYPNQLEFLRDMAEKTYRESPFIKPFFALQAQVERRHAGHKPEDLRSRHELNKKVRMEFHALKGLVNNVNRGLEIDTEIARLKTSALACLLHKLIQEDAFGRTSHAAAAWIEQSQVANSGEQGRHLILEELAAAATAAGSPALLRARATDWADGAAILLTKVFVPKAAVQIVQKKYFDGHPMLYPDIEHAAERTIREIVDAVTLFNEYVRAKVEGPSQDAEQPARSQDETPPAVTGAQEGYPWKRLRIDVEHIRSRSSERALEMVSKWVSSARHKGIVDILQETGEHESVVWESFCEEVGTMTHARASCR